MPPMVLAATRLRNPLRVGEGVVQGGDCSRRRRQQVGWRKGQALHQGVQVIPGEPGMVFGSGGPGAAPGAPVVGDAAVADGGEGGQLVDPAVTRPGGGMKEDYRGSRPAGVLVVQVDSRQRQVRQYSPSLRKGWTNQAVAAYAVVPFGLV